MGAVIKDDRGSCCSGTHPAPACGRCPAGGSNPARRTPRPCRPNARRNRPVSAGRTAGRNGTATRPGRRRPRHQGTTRPRSPAQRPARATTRPRRTGRHPAHWIRRRARSARRKHSPIAVFSAKAVLIVLFFLLRGAGTASRSGGRGRGTSRLIRRQPAFREPRKSASRQRSPRNPTQETAPCVTFVMRVKGAGISLTSVYACDPGSFSFSGRVLAG